MNCCERKCNCGPTCSLAVIVGLLFGAIIGVLFALDFIPNIILAVWIVLALGVLALALLFVSALTSGVVMCGVLIKCLRQHTTCLLTGIIGTIISTIILISVVLDPALLLVQIFIAIAAFFFVFMLTELIFFIYCLACENRYNYEG